jgi:hypothetical protein
VEGAGGYSRRVPFETTFIRDRDYARAVLFRIHRTRIWIMLGAAIALVIIGLWVPFAFLGGLVVAYFGLTLSRRMVRKLPPAWYAEQHVTFTDERIDIRGGSEHQEIAWNLVTGVQVTPKAVLIRGGSSALDIPIDALTPDQITALATRVTA